MSPEESSRQICAEIPRVLREAREKAGLSANKLAELAGLNRQAITFIERGDRIPSVETFGRIALALGTQPSKLWRKAEQILSQSD